MIVSGTHINFPVIAVGSKAVGVSSTMRTPVIPISTLEIRYIPAGIPIKGSWKLKSDLVIINRVEEDQFIATVPLLQEYGIGNNTESAIDDLLTSLVDYMESLLRREDRLSEPLKKDFENLKKLLDK